MISPHRTFGVARSSRVARLIASVAVGVAVVGSVTGCGFTAPMRTATGYSPSDGINVRDSGPLDVRNALIVVDEDGTVGNFVAAIVNMTDSPETLTMQVGEGADPLTETLSVKANSVVSLGAEDTEPLRLEGIDAKPGSTLRVFFQSGDAEGVNSNVPVLNGQQNYLSTLVPTPSPSASR